MLCKPTTPRLWYFVRVAPANEYTETSSICQHILSSWNMSLEYFLFGLSPEVPLLPESSFLSEAQTSRATFFLHCWRAASSNTGSYLLALCAGGPLGLGSKYDDVLFFSHSSVYAHLLLVLSTRSLVTVPLAVRWNDN